MGPHIVTVIVAILALVISSSPASAQTGAVADLVDTNNKTVGTVEMVQSAHGVLLDVRLEGLPEGSHAFHIHETGECEPPFESAGGHFNPDDAEHGLMDADGMHAGDLPNIHMPAGALRLEILVPGVVLAEGEQNSLLDEDGSAFVIHEGTDDYISDPAGDAGDRIACGVVEATE